MPSIKPDPSLSFHSVDLNTLLADQSDTLEPPSSIPNVSHRSSDFSLVDEQRLQAAKESEILEANSDIDNDETTSASQSLSHHPIPAYRTIYDILPPRSPPLKSATDHYDLTSPSSTASSSSSHLASINDQQVIDIDSALREVLSGIRTVEECHAQCFRAISSSNTQQETDAPDLVLNLPVSHGFVTPPASKSLDEHLSSKSPSPTSNNNSVSLVHSTIILDVSSKSRSNSPSLDSTQEKKVPPPIMKKPEKTLQLMKRLGLQQAPDLSPVRFNGLHHQSLSVSGSPKVTEV
jgi:hypothetical protein